MFWGVLAIRAEVFQIRGGTGPKRRVRGDIRPNWDERQRNGWEELPE